LRIRLVHPAEIELKEAIEYYNSQVPDLGNEFYKEFDKALKRIQQFPDAWPKIGEHTRRCLLKKFPYEILYVLEKNIILILAVANMHRDPKNYKDRIS